MVEQERTGVGADQPSQATIMTTVTDAGRDRNGASSPDNAMRVEQATDRIAATERPISLRTENMSLYYGEFRALRDVSVEIPERTVTAIIGRVRLRQEFFPAQFQSDERSDPGRAG